VPLRAVLPLAADLVKLTATPLRDGSHGIRIWLHEDGSDGDSGADIDTMAVLEPLSQHECEITLTHGTLNDEANVLIALKAIEMGFKVLHFHRSAGGPASHWAEYKKTVDGMDYYTVDLVKQLAVYEGMR